MMLLEASDCPKSLPSKSPSRIARNCIDSSRSRAQPRAQRAVDGAPIYVPSGTARQGLPPGTAVLHREPCRVFTLFLSKNGTHPSHSMGCAVPSRIVLVLKVSLISALTSTVTSGRRELNIRQYFCYDPALLLRSTGAVTQVSLSQYLSSWHVIWLNSDLHNFP